VFLVIIVHPGSSSSHFSSLRAVVFTNLKAPPIRWVGLVKSQIKRRGGKDDHPFFEDG